MYPKEIEKFLLKVQKPGRYVGGEVNSVVKDKREVEVRFAFCFPDLYEIGMSHLGIKILYGAFNQMPYFWCERVFLDRYGKADGGTPHPPVCPGKRRSGKRL